MSGAGSCRLCAGDSTATRHGLGCPNKRPIDVWRDAAAEEQERQEIEGAIILAVFLLAALAWGVCHAFGWFGL